MAALGLWPSEDSNQELCVLFVCFRGEEATLDVKGGGNIVLCSQAFYFLFFFFAFFQQKAMIVI